MGDLVHGVPTLLQLRNLVRHQGDSLLLRHLTLRAVLRRKFFQLSPQVIDLFNRDSHALARWLMMRATNVAPIRIVDTIRTGGYSLPSTGKRLEGTG